MIRRAVAADAAALAALNAEVQALHVGWDPARYHPSDPADVVAFFEGLLGREDGVVALAEGPEPLGYVVGILTRRDATPFTPAAVTMSVDQIGVRAAARGTGVGRALMAWIEAEAEARGCGRLQLDVHAANAAAQAFYRRLGYAPERMRLGKVVPGDSG